MDLDGGLDKFRQLKRKKLKQMVVDGEIELRLES